MTEEKTKKNAESKDSNDFKVKFCYKNRKNVDSED